MKVDRLEVTNIASLRGTHHIDFENVLAKEGLFAITGPTGSGKSTLLSAISLALYGQGGKKGLNASDYVSEGAAAGEINLYFRMGNSKYRAYWQCTLLKKNGSPLSKVTPKKYLEDLQTGEILEKNASDVIQLTLDQFNQCVVLHQGEFANFLGSTFSNRRSILEKLINISEIDRIKKTYDESNKELESQIKSLSDRLESNQIFSAEEVQELQKKEDEYKSSLILLEKDSLLQNEVHTHFTKICEYLISLEQSQTKKETTTKQLEDFTGDYQNAHLSFKKSEEVKVEIEKAWKAERPLASGALETENKLQNQQVLLKRIENDLSSLNQKQATRTEEIANLKKALEDISFDYSQDFLAQNLSLRQEILSDLKSLYDGQVLFQSNEKRIEVLALDLKAGHDNALKLKSEIGENPEAQLSKSKEELLACEKKLLVIEEELKKLLALKTHLEILSPQVQALRQKYSMREEERKGQSKLEDLIAILEGKKNLLEKDRQLFEHSQTIQLLKELSLKNDECELCGQKHPTLKSHSTVRDYDPSERLKEIEALESKKRGLELIEKDLSDYSEQISTKEREIKELLEKFNLNNFEELAHQITEVESAKAQQKLIQSKLDEEQVKLTVGAEKLKSLRETYQRIQLQKRDLEEQNNKLKTNQESIVKKRSLLSDISLVPSDLSQLRDKIETNLSRFEKKLIQERHVEKSEKELKEIKNDVEEALKQRNTIQDQCEQLKKQIPDQYRNISLKQFIEEKDELIKSNKEELWAMERGLDEKKLACERTKEALSHINENIKNSQGQLLKLTQELHQKLQDLFTNSHLSELANEPVMAIAQKGLGPIGELRSDIVSEILSHTITPWLNEFKEKIKTIQNQVAEIKSKLELHQSRTKIGEALQKELFEKNQKFTLYQNLKDFFSKNDFKNYVLSLIEEELIKATNSELKKLCEGRYILKSRPTSNGPEFIVIDHWISFSERKVASLSGGETFMVSLALALGLAEMTRGKTQIDSFFIDEGFGSLDEQTLESVAEVLLNLRGRGKTIGVISHVEALTSRLPRSLRLEKHSAGSSSLSYQEVIF